MPKPMKKSGGSRAVEKKHLERDAKRPDGWWKARRRKILALLRRMPKDPAKLTGWLAEAGAFCVADALDDPGIPPELQREQVARLIPQVVKSSEPGKLAVRLEDYERVIADLRERLMERSAGSAAAFDPAEASGARPASPLS